MSAWEKVAKEKQEELKSSIKVQVEDLVEDAADEIEEDTLEEVGENIWDMYIAAGVEAAIEGLGFVDDFSGEDEYSEVWDVLYEYFWQVYREEADKLFE